MRLIRMGKVAKKILKLVAKVRFSVRTLLLIVFVVALLLGSVVPYFGYRRQLGEIARLHGSATTRPCWQARLIGDARTGPIVTACFPYGIDDAGLTMVGQLAELEDLEIFMPGFGCLILKGPMSLPLSPTGPTLVHLRSLRKLRRLSIDATWLDDDALEHVGRLDQLEELSLDQTQDVETDEHPTGAGLAHLRSLDKLRRLSLGNRWMRNDVLKHVTILDQLEELRLIRTFDSMGQIDLETIGSLHNRSRLRRLKLNIPGLPDEALDQVRKLVLLEELTLSNAEITDEGLHRLAGLNRLRSLTLDRSKIEGGGLDYLQELPGLRVLTLTMNGSLDDMAFAHLVGATQIRKLGVDGGVDTQSLAHLKAMNHLEILELGSHTLTKDQNDELKSSLPSTRLLIPDPPPVYMSGFR